MKLYTNSQGDVIDDTNSLPNKEQIVVNNEVDTVEDEQNVVVRVDCPCENREVENGRPLIETQLATRSNEVDTVEDVQMTAVVNNMVNRSMVETVVIEPTQELCSLEVEPNLFMSRCNTQLQCIAEGHKNSLDTEGSDAEDPFLSCHVATSATAWIDPIATLEAHICCSAPLLRRAVTQEISSSKKTRGRPKRNRTQNQSNTTPIPESLIEAHKTWNTAKRLDVSARDEDMVISELRKSKRIMALENRSPS